MSSPSLVTRSYNVPTSCLKVDIMNGQLTMMASMCDDRDVSQACALRNFIFVVGSWRDIDFTSVKTCESYDVLKNEWARLPC